MKNDPKNSVAVTHALKSDQRTAGVNTAVVDAKGWEYVLFIVNIGDMASTASTIMTVQDSAEDDANFVNVAGTSTTFTEAGSDDDATYLVQVRTAIRDQYIRLSFTNAGGDAIDISVNAVTFNPDRQVDLVDLTAVTLAI